MTEMTSTEDQALQSHIAVRCEELLATVRKGKQLSIGERTELGKLQRLCAHHRNPRSRELEGEECENCGATMG